MAKWVVGVLLVLAAAGAIYALRQQTSGERKEAPRGGGSDAAATKGGAAKGAAGKGAGDPRSARVVAVIETKAVRRDVPIYLDGLGAVQAGRMVTVRPQVDGRLEKVLFREGQEVKRGMVLAQIDARPFQIQLHQAEGAVARDKAALENARVNLKRYQELREKKMVAQQQVDDTAAQVGQLEGAVRIGRAAIESARLNLDYARITAPIDGVAGVRLIDQGNIVRQADPNGLVVLTQLDPISVVFTLPQDDLPRVSEAMQRGKLVVEAFSRDGQTKLGTGELDLIDNQINAATSTMRLKASFPNPQRVLWPNQFVKARLLLSTTKDALVVPSAAVQRGPDGPFVYAIQADSTVQAKGVDVVLTQADFSVIGKGINPGDRVVVEGQNQLRPGAKVNPRELNADKRGGGQGKGNVAGGR